MEIPAKEVVLKNGKRAVLRSPKPEDAKALVDFVSQAAVQTPFLYMTPEDGFPTVETEAQWITNTCQSPTSAMIICEADGCLAGNCSISYSPRYKIRHRGHVAIAILREYWGNHIGTLLFEEMFSIARAWNLSQLELTFVEGNDRARGLYEKMGFRIFGEIPNAVRQSDGRLCREFQMLRTLK